MLNSGDGTSYAGTLYADATLWGGSRREAPRSSRRTRHAAARCTTGHPRVSAVPADGLLPSVGIRDGDAVEMRGHLADAEDESRDDAPQAAGHGGAVAETEPREGKEERRRRGARGAPPRAPVRDDALVERHEQERSSAMHPVSSKRSVR